VSPKNIVSIQILRLDPRTVARPPAPAISPAPAVRGPDVATLSRIKLPENPTREQAKRYIMEIAAASGGQNSWSPSDPQVRMYADIGAENLPLLFEVPGVNDYHLVSAAKVIATDKHKEMIIKYLRLMPELSAVVVAKGWEKDAREVLVRLLKDRADYLPESVVRAVVNLGDASTYEHLKQHFVRGSNKARTYEAIKGLPGIDLRDSVAAAWESAKTRRYERESMAPIALSFGNTDALAAAVTYLSSPARSGTAFHYAEKGIREALLSHTDARARTKRSSGGTRRTARSSTSMNTRGAFGPRSRDTSTTENARGAERTSPYELQRRTTTEDETCTGCHPAPRLLRLQLRATPSRQGPGTLRRAVEERRFCEPQQGRTACGSRLGA